jgi:signal transduction histidine kinase
MRPDETWLCFFAEKDDLAAALHQRTAAWLGSVLRASALVVAATTVAAALTRSGALWGIYGAFALVIVIALALDRAKRVREAGIVLSLGFWAAATSAVFLLGGVRSPGTFVYLPIVLTAGLFWSWRAAATLTVASLGAEMLAAWLAAIDRLPLPLQTPTTERLLPIFAGSLTMTGVLVGIALQTLQGALHDVRAATEDARRQAQRSDELRADLELHAKRSRHLEAMGLLAGGVAHDFNNLLAVILSLGAVLDQRLAPDSPARKVLGEINESAVRAAELARELLSPKSTPLVEPIDIGRELAAFVPVLTHLAGAGITLSLLRHGGPALVKIEKAKLERIATNLVINARDAMPKGGEIVVEVAPVRRNFDAVPAGVVELSVADSGVGMEPAIQQRIFEPFFTTKGGSGAGLGLATVDEIVSSIGGSIGVDSEPGHGTKIRVLLPEAEGKSLTP